MHAFEGVALKLSQASRLFLVVASLPAGLGRAREDPCQSGRESRSQEAIDDDVGMGPGDGVGVSMGQRERAKRRTREEETRAQQGAFFEGGDAHRASP
jgi:hypothetical protein